MMELRGYREMLFRILTELCYGIPEEYLTSELRAAKSDLCELRDALQGFPSALRAGSGPLLHLLITAANTVREELGDDDLFIRAEISPAEHEKLIRWLERGAPAED